MTQPVIFISYSRRDNAEKNKMMSHLGVLQQAGLVDLWSDDRIEAGENWHVQMQQAITQAKIAVLLITAHFLNSEFILSAEVPTLLQRCQNDGLVVYPILARACAWRSVNWLRDMDVWPKSGVPVWSDGGIHVDEDLSVIAEDISNGITLKKHTPFVLPRPMSEWVQPLIPAQKTGNPRQILVVDDELSWQKRLTRILREIDCTVVAVGNYEQAENLLDNFKFDLVTVDLNLDQSTRYADGLELVLRIRETFGPHIPVIVVTGTGNLEEQRRAFKEYGVFDFIQKAKLDLEQFKDIVKDAIAHSTA